MRDFHPHVMVAAVALVVAACAIPSPSVAPGGTTTADGAATPRPSPDATSAAEDAVFGRWRRTPAHPTADMTVAAETACRDQPPVGDLPLVVTDARGDGELTLVFASAKAAAVCHATLARSGAATADARKVTRYPAPAPASEKLGIHDLEVIDSTTGARSVLVGQVAEDVARVSAQFQDATWSHASMADGWYAMWWPGRDPALTVAAVNRRSIAVDGFAP